MDQKEAQQTRILAEQEIDPRLDLAVIRTELALDRTQLAWVRTAFTFITAGLALDKGAEAMHHARVLAGTNWLKSSHAIGVSLTGSATLALLFASYTYFQQTRRMARLKNASIWIPPVLLISLFVVLLGGTLSILLLTWHGVEL